MTVLCAEVITSEKEIEERSTSTLAEIVKELDQVKFR